MPVGASIPSTNHHMGKIIVEFHSQRPRCVFFCICSLLTSWLATSKIQPDTTWTGKSSPPGWRSWISLPGISLTADPPHTRLAHYTQRVEQHCAELHNSSPSTVPRAKNLSITFIGHLRRQVMEIINLNLVSHISPRVESTHCVHLSLLKEKKK